MRCASTGETDSRGKTANTRSRLAKSATRVRQSGQAARCASAFSLISSGRPLARYESISGARVPQFILVLLPPCSQARSQKLFRAEKVRAYGVDRKLQ